jgi:hypothetical protein
VQQALLVHQLTTAPGGTASRQLPGQWVVVQLVQLEGLHGLGLQVEAIQAQKGTSVVILEPRDGHWGSLIEEDLLRSYATDWLV